MLSDANEEASHVFLELTRLPRRSLWKRRRISLQLVYTIRKDNCAQIDSGVDWYFDTASQQQSVEPSLLFIKVLLQTLRGVCSAADITVEGSFGPVDSSSTIYHPHVLGDRSVRLLFLCAHSVHSNQRRQYWRTSSKIEYQPQRKLSFLLA
jgi:hypothetical protein